MSVDELAKVVSALTVVNATTNKRKQSGLPRSPGLDCPSIYSGVLPLLVRTSEIAAVKSSTPVLGTMMLLRRP
jgi:hypothetical protein